jgi:hypothetical protein
MEMKEIRTMTIKEKFGVIEIFYKDGGSDEKED